jgi:hypothetical protein
MNIKELNSKRLQSFQLTNPWRKASKAKVLNYKIIGNGTGIHWPSPDEDLSLKGILRDELLKVVKPSSVIIDE